MPRKLGLDAELEAERTELDERYIMRRPSYKALEESFRALQAEHNNMWLLLIDIVRGDDQSVTCGSGAAKVKVHFGRLTGALCGLVAVWVDQMVRVWTLDDWRASIKATIPHGKKEYALDDAILANQQKALAHILAAREQAWPQPVTAESPWQRWRAS